MPAFDAVNICFFGMNRSLSATVGSINKYLFDSLDDIDVDYSVFGAFVKVDSFSNERSHEFNVKPESNESDLIQFASLKYVDQGAVDDLIRWDLVFRFGDTYQQINADDELKNSNSTTKNIFRSLFSLKCSFGLVPQSLWDRPTIFLRPDLEILSSIDFKLYLSLLFKHSAKYAYGDSDGVAIFPSWHSWDGLNDRFAIASPGNATTTYANRFDCLFPYLEISKHPLHPELFLQQMMRASRVEVLPILTSHMVRMRSDGKPQAENFAVGHRGFDPESKVMAALHKLVEERGVEISRLEKQINELSQLLQLKDRELEEGRGAEISRLEEQVIDLSRLLQTKDSELEQEIKSKEVRLQEFEDTKKEVENLKVHFHTASKELSVINADLEKRIHSLEKEKLLAENSAEVLKSQLDEQRKRVQSLEASADVSMRQLHQVQNELEEYFLLSREQSALLEANSDLQDRLKKLCVRAIH